MPDVGGGRRGRWRGCWRSSAGAPIAWRWWCRTRWPRCRCCGSRRCPAAPRTCARSSAGRCGRASPFPVEQAVLSVTPGRAARTTAGVSSWSRWPARTSSSSTSRPAPMAKAEAGLVDLATFGILNSVRRRRRRAGGGLAAGARDRQLHHAGGGARRAPHLHPASLGGVGGHAGGSHSPDGDVLRGPAEGRGLRPGAGWRAPRRSTGADSVRRDLEDAAAASASRTWIRARPPRSSIASAPRRN